MPRGYQSYIFCSGRRMGLTFIEIVISVAVLSIVAGSVIEFTHIAERRRREIELRRVLRQTREAIDRYYDDQNRINPLQPEGLKYPRDLQELVDKKYLRRLPVNPLGAQANFEIIPWNENQENVYDIVPRFEEPSFDGKAALDGSVYEKW